MGKKQASVPVEYVFCVSKVPIFDQGPKVLTDMGLDRIHLLVVRAKSLRGVSDMLTCRYNRSPDTY